MDLNNQVVQLCIQGTQAEFQGRQPDAQTLYHLAWETAKDDYEKCIAAHYVARLGRTPEESFKWDQEALNRANAANPILVKEFYPSLYLSMGRSYERLGNLVEAQRYYDLAASLGAMHQPE
jgi:hypothetical protein